MKDGLENIDEIIKQAFEGFESNVDPSVWNNVQNSISSGSGGSSSPQVDPTTVASVAGKSIAVKIVAGVALLGAVVTGAVYLPGLFEDKATEISENTVVDNDPIQDTEEVIVPIEKNSSEEVISEKVQKNDEIENPVDVIDHVKENKESGKSNSVTDVSATETDVTNSENKSATPVTKPVIVNPTPKNEKVKNPTKDAAENEKPVEFKVNINVDNKKGTAPFTVQFDGLGEGIESYFWDFGDDSDEAHEEAPIHTFMKEGTYRVKLTVMNITGETNEAYYYIIVEKDYSSSLQPISNVFSPNGDTENDFIKIRGKNIKGIQVRIADSKGKIIYLMNSLDDKWEGKDQNGNYLPQGQYYMTVIAIGNDGKKHVKKQVVNLLK